MTEGKSFYENPYPSNVKLAMTRNISLAYSYL